MQACCGGNHPEALAQNAEGFLDGAIMGRVNNRQSFPPFSASPYFAARRFPILPPELIQPKRAPFPKFEKFIFGGKVNSTTFGCVHYASAVGKLMVLRE